MRGSRRRMDEQSAATASLMSLLKRTGHLQLFLYRWVQRYKLTSLSTSPLRASNPWSRAQPQSQGLTHFCWLFLLFPFYSPPGLAGRAAEVQARLHRPFPEQTARAGAKGPGEEGPGPFGGPAAGRRRRAEESPQCSGNLSDRYGASSHLSHAAHCPVAAAVAVCHIIITHTYRQRTKSERGGGEGSLAQFYIYI